MSPGVGLRSLGEAGLEVLDLVHEVRSDLSRCFAWGPRSRDGVEWTGFRGVKQAARPE